MLFCEDERAAVTDSLRGQSEDGKVSLAEVSRALSQRWADLQAEARTAFEERATAEKHNQQAQVQAGIDASNPVAPMRRQFEHLIPKRPLTAYFLFLQDTEQRAKAEAQLQEEGKTVSAATMGSRMGQSWRDLEPDTKASFVARAEAAFAAYREAVQKWQQMPEYSELQECQRKHRADERRKGIEAAKGIKRSHNLDDDVIEVSTPSASSSDQTVVTPPRTTARAVRRRPLTMMDINETVLLEAQKLSLDIVLLELAGCSQVLEKGIKSRSIEGARILLKALELSKGDLKGAIDQLCSTCVIVE